jgi:hypothetical protein
MILCIGSVLVRSWHLADLSYCLTGVRFALKSGRLRLMCIHYDQPDGAPPPRQRYRDRRSSGGNGSWQSA